MLLLDDVFLLKWNRQVIQIVGASFENNKQTKNLIRKTRMEDFSTTVFLHFITDALKRTENITVTNSIN